MGLSFLLAMSDLFERLQSFITKNSETFVMLWASFLGIVVRLIFESKKEGFKVTTMLFLSRWAVAIFVGWMVSGYLNHYPDLMDWYGQIIAISAVISYELLTILIKDVPEFFRNYLMTKYGPKKEGDNQ